LRQANFWARNSKVRGGAGWQPADVGQLADEISAAKKIFGKLSKKTG